MSKDNAINQREENIDIFLKNLSRYFSTKTTPTGFYNKVGKIEERLGEFITLGEKFSKNIEESSRASEELTKALNRITLWGVIIAGISLFIALIHLILEVKSI